MINEGVRLQKVLSQAGIASRRNTERMILDGRVEVDGRVVTELGTRVDPDSADIRVDGSRVVLDESMVYLAVNKPVGMHSTMSDDRGRPCIGDLIEHRVRGNTGLFHVGRLDADTEGFNLANVTLSYLDRGDAIDLRTLAVTPSPEKADETALDPNAADFRPYYDQRMFYTDILGNATVADLMGRLIDNAESEAIGLAFSGLDAQNRPSDGFEFRFYRGPESRGWYTESFGGEDYTVLNIHLDIHPIRISGPLYEQRRGRAADRAMPDEAEAEGEKAVADARGGEPAAP